MGRVRGVGTLVAAAVAMGAIASAAASAQPPEFGRCIKQVAVEKGFHGKYGNSKCTVAVSPEEEAKKGKYEWFPGAVAGENHFTIAGGPLTVRTTPGNRGITCSGEKGEGEYSLTDSKRLTGVVLEFSGCQDGTFKCTSAGREAGELVFDELAGEVDYQDAGKIKTALKLELDPATEGEPIVFHCFGSEDRIRGRGGEAGAGILVPIKNDSMKATETLKFTASKKALQKPLAWEGSPAETYPEFSLESLPFEQAGWNNELTITNDEEMKYELNRLF
jgi:uncharacterized low-complexity protein